MLLFLDCLRIVGSFFIANLMRWVQGIRNLVLWQINVVDFTYFYMCYAQLQRGELKNLKFFISYTINVE
jgi:hypothetical protein